MATQILRRKGEYGRRLLKTGAVIVSSFCIGASFAKYREKERASSNSLAVNIQQLPSTHRVLISSIQSLTQSPQTPETFVSASKEVLSQIRKLKPNIATHHVLRIQAATLLQQYHNNLDTILTQRSINNEIDIDEYNMHFQRKLDDMAFAFDLINFKKTEVSTNITSLMKLNKIDYARQSRDPQRLKTAYDDIIQSAKRLMKSQDESIQNIDMTKDESEDASITQDKLTDIDQGSLLESDLMAIYTHAPYLGEWKTFEKIGNSLVKDYNRFDFIVNGSSGHKDGIDFSDLYLLCKDYKCGENIPSRLYNELKFDQKQIKSIKLQYDNASLLSSPSNTLNTSNASNSPQTDSNISNNTNSSSSWFGGFTSESNQVKAVSQELESILNQYNNKSIKPIEINYAHNESGRAKYKKNKKSNESDNNNEIDTGLVGMGIRRLGGVQKAASLTKCVKRVQGPVLYDGSVKMQGSMTVLVPKSNLERIGNSNNNNNGGKGDNNNVVPNDIPLIGAGEFISIKQTEIWDLLPNETNPNLLQGKVVIRREPANEKDRNEIDSFEVEYKCNMELNAKPAGFTS